MRSWAESMADRENTPAKRIVRDQCPVCPGDLDTGYECTRCGYDASPEPLPRILEGFRP